MSDLLLELNHCGSKTWVKLGELEINKPYKIKEVKRLPSKFHPEKTQTIVYLENGYTVTLPARFNDLDQKLFLELQKGLYMINKGASVEMNHLLNVMQMDCQFEWIKCIQNNIALQTWTRPIPLTLIHGNVHLVLTELYKDSNCNNDDIYALLLLWDNITEYQEDTFGNSNVEIIEWLELLKSMPHTYFENNVFSESLGSIYCIMEKFDFNKPVESEVVIEDSDEETLSSGENTYISETEYVKYSHNQIHYVPNNVRLPSLHYAEPTASSSIVTNNSFDSKSKMEVDTYDKKLSTKKKLHKEYDVKVPIYDKTPKLKKIREKKIPEKDVNEHLKEQKYLSNIKTQNICLNNMSQEANDIEEHLKIYSELITCVCENIVSIFKQIRNMELRMLNLSDMNLYNAFVKKITLYFFSLSYSTVITIFVPRKDNVQFKNYVINTTTGIAKKQNIICEYQKLEELYRDLLQWAQSHKKQLEFDRTTKIFEGVNSSNKPKAKEPATVKGYVMPNPNDDVPFSLNTTGSKISIEVSLTTHNSELKNNGNNSADPMPSGSNLSNDKNFIELTSKTVSDEKNNNNNCSGNTQIPQNATMPKASWTPIQQTMSSEMHNQTYNNEKRMNIYSYDQSDPSQLPYSHQRPAYNPWNTKPYFHPNPPQIPHSARNNCQARGYDYFPNKINRAPQPYPGQPAFSNNPLHRQTKNSQEKDIPYYIQNLRNINDPMASHLLKSKIMNVTSYNFQANQTVIPHDQPTSTNPPIQKPPCCNEQKNVYNVLNHSFNAPLNFNASPTNGTYSHLQKRPTYKLQEEWPDILSLLHSEISCTDGGLTNLNTQQETNIDKAHDVRKSLSRDSGFTSPLNFSTDEMLNNTEEVGKAAKHMPVITHITSLNPSAIQLNAEKCLVCGTRTRNKCMRCCINYYCSNDCQARDWKLHKPICTQWAATLNTKKIE